MPEIYSIYMRAYALYIGGTEAAMESLINAYDDGEEDKLKLAAVTIGVMHASMELSLYGLVDFNVALDKLFDTEE